MEHINVVFVEFQYMQILFVRIKDWEIMKKGFVLFVHWKIILMRRIEHANLGIEKMFKKKAE